MDPAALAERLPSGKEVFGDGSAAFRLPQLISIPSYLILVAGAAWSAWRMRGRPELRSRFIGTLLVAAGATITAAAGSAFAAVGNLPAFSLSLLAGVAVMFAGLPAGDRVPPAPNGAISPRTDGSGLWTGDPIGAQRANQGLTAPEGRGIAGARPGTSRTRRAGADGDVPPLAPTSRSQPQEGIPLSSSRIRRAAALAVTGALAVAAFAGLGPVASTASSHREAPLVSADPPIDATDLYAFVPDSAPDKVALVGSWIPFEEPAGGPNFYLWAERTNYDINIDNDGDAQRGHHLPLAVHDASPQPRLVHLQQRAGHVAERSRTSSSTRPTT